MHGLLAAPGRAFVSGVLLAVLTLLPGVARATVCTLPGDCFSVGEVCNLGLCTPCGSNFTDGGLNGGLLSCQDPALPICDVPDGSVGGQCVQCTENGNCSGGQTCDLATQTCVPGDGGDAGAQDAGERDGSSSDGGGEDASLHDAGGSESDAAAPSQDAAGPPADGASPGQDASGGASEDGSSEDGSSEDASGEGGSSLGDGVYVEGGGCTCNALGGSGSASVGGAALAFVVALAGIRRRRSR